VNTTGTCTVLTLIAASLVACGGSAMVDYGRPFPLALKQIETINVQVLRKETEITLTNTSARALPATTMWINRQYSRPIDSLDIGRSVTLPLGSFRNEFSEPFRAGGFFATEKPDRIVQVQLETEDGLVGLLMVGER
jgi:hypothetical protein